MKQDDKGLWLLATLIPMTLAVELLEAVLPINGQP